MGPHGGPTRRWRSGRYWSNVTAGLGVRSITAYLLPKGMFQPVFHVQCQHALLPIQDELPHFKDYPAMLGGSAER